MNTTTQTTHQTACPATAGGPRNTGKRALALATLAALAAGGEAQGAFPPQIPRCLTPFGPSTSMDLPNTTQGPFWPPAEVVDANGDFLLVGNALAEVAPGVIAPIPDQALLVSKETVPALDANGVEDADNWFGAPYSVVRPLDLSAGSADLDTVLHSVSFGPPEGDFGRAPRIPRLGDSSFNLNGDLTVCPEVFPSESQRLTYTRPSFPLHEVPVWGFQGDGVSYDVDTGAPFDPQTTTGPGCEQLGCPGEDAVDTRDGSEITLGEWLSAKGRLRINLTGRDPATGDYTHARFSFRLRNLLPNSIYTIWAVRLRQVPVPGVYERRDIDPLAVPNVIVTNNFGFGYGSFLVRNPFPDPATDATGRRIIGVSIVYHSDHQSWGACFSRLGPGVDVHAVFSTLADGTGITPDRPFTTFVTAEPQTPALCED